MKTECTNDAFRNKIRKILNSSPPVSARGAFKGRVFAEVQNYSKELQEEDNASDFFFRLCELIVDCQSLSIPDESFRVIVAGLLCEPEDSEVCPDEEVRRMIGMDAENYNAAKEHFKDSQCIVSALNREKTVRRSSIMTGKRNFSRSEQTGAHT